MFVNPILPQGHDEDSVNYAALDETLGFLENSILVFEARRIDM
jgi:hypothetical protein